MWKLKILVGIVVFSGIVLGWYGVKNSSKTIVVKNAPMEDFADAEINVNEKTGAADAGVEAVFGEPLLRARERVTKKPFGIKISPSNSPIQPEKFSGYHTGTDFEIFPEEADAPVEVFAICDGKIIQKSNISGYGGVLAQKCEPEGSPVTVIYGHLSADESVENGKELARGEKIGILGAAKSAETDGERKHLHLGIKKGSAIDARGYVATEKELEQWLDIYAEKKAENAAAENSPEEKSASGVESKIENKEAEESKEIEEVKKVEKEETENKEVAVAGISERLISWGYQNASGRKIDTIIIHSSYDALGDDPYDTNGLIKEYKQYGVAAHYLIDRQGKIYRLVKDKNIAYHAGVAKVPDGRTEVNSFSIGIELMNTKTDKYTQAQYGAVKNLVAGLKEQYKIKYVLGHDQIAPGRKDDPWNFDWSKL